MLRAIAASSPSITSGVRDITAGPLRTTFARLQAADEDAPLSVGRFAQRLKLLDQRRHPFTELDLGEENADCPVAIDEKVGALST